MCRPNYVFYDGNLKESDTDDITDCVPRLYPDCTALGGSRDVMTGQCQSDNSICVLQCTTSGGVGTFNRQLGFCECAGVTDAGDICDAPCRQQQPKFSFDPATSSFIIAFSNSTTVAFSSQSMPGRFSCTNTSGCGVHAVQQLDQASVGVLKPSDSFSLALFGSPLRSSPLPSYVASNISFMGGAGDGLRGIVGDSYASVSSRTTTVISAEPGVSNPIMCIAEGDFIVWSLSSADNFPVYVPDNLLNTNPEFDYGAFLDLKSRMLTGQSTVASFSFAFADAGTYVFGDYSNVDRLLIVRVMPSNQSCPSTSSAMATTALNAVSVGISRDNNVSTPPNWFVIGLIIGGATLVMAATVAACFYLRRAKAANVEYKRLGEDEFLTLSTAGGRRSSAKDADGDDTAISMLEDFSVRTFYDKLEDATIHVVSQIANANLQGLQMYQAMLDETERIKALLAGQAGADPVPSASSGKGAGSSAATSTATGAAKVELEMPKHFTDALSQFIKTTLDEMGLNPETIRQSQAAAGGGVAVAGTGAGIRAGRERSGSVRPGGAPAHGVDGSGRPHSEDFSFLETVLDAESLPLLLQSEADVRAEEAANLDYVSASVVAQHYKGLLDVSGLPPVSDQEERLLAVERRIADRRRRSLRRHTFERAELEAEQNMAERSTMDALSAQIEAEKRSATAETPDLVEAIEEEARRHRDHMMRLLQEARDRRMQTLDQRHARETDEENVLGRAEREALAASLASTAGGHGHSTVRDEWKRQRELIERRSKDRRILREKEIGAELEDLERECASEETAMVSHTESRMDRVAEAEMSALETRRNEELSKAQTELQRRRIMEMFAREMEELESATEYERDRQIQLARDRAEALRRKKEAILRKRHAEMQEADLAEDRRELDAIIMAAALVQGGQTSESLAEQLKEDEERAYRDADEHLARIRRLRETQLKDSAEIMAASPDVTEEEKSRLMAQLQRDMQFVDVQIEQERLRQRELVAQRMAQRKARIAQMRLRMLERESAAVGAVDSSSAGVKQQQKDPSSQAGQDGRGAADATKGKSSIEELLQNAGIVSSVAGGDGAIDDAEDAGHGMAGDGASLLDVNQQAASLVDQIFESDSGLQSSSPVAGGRAGAAASSSSTGATALAASAVDGWMRAAMAKLQTQLEIDLQNATTREQKEAALAAFRKGLEDVVRGHEQLEASVVHAHSSLTATVVEERNETCKLAVDDTRMQEKIAGDLVQAMTTEELAIERSLEDLRRKRQTEIAVRRDERFLEMRTASASSSKAVSQSAVDMVLRKFDEESRAADAEIAAEYDRQRAMMLAKMSKRRERIVQKNKLAVDSEVVGTQENHLDALEATVLFGSESEKTSRVARRTMLELQRDARLSAAALDESEKTRIMKEFDESVFRMEDALAAERKRQVEESVRRIAARKAKAVHSVETTKLLEMVRNDSSEASAIDAEYVSALTSSEALLTERMLREEGALRERRDALLTNAVGGPAEVKRIMENYDSEFTQLQQGIEREKMAQAAKVAEKVRQRRRTQGAIGTGPGAASAEGPRSGKPTAVLSQMSLASVSVAEGDTMKTIESEIALRRSVLMEAARRERDERLLSGRERPGDILAAYDAAIDKISLILDKERDEMIGRLADDLSVRRATAVASLAVVAAPAGAGAGASAASSAAADDAQQEAELAQLGVASESQRKDRIATAQRTLEAKLKKASSAGTKQEDLDRVLREHALAVANIESEVLSERCRQEEVVRQKMEQRRRERKARLVESVVAAEEARAPVASGSSSSGLEAQQGEERLAATIAEAAVTREKLVLKAQAQERARRDHDHAAEIMEEYAEQCQALDANLEAERARQQAMVRERQALKKAAVSQRLKAVFDDAGPTSAPGVHSTATASAAAPSAADEAAISAAASSATTAARIEELAIRSAQELAKASASQEKQRILDEFAHQVREMEDATDRERTRQAAAIAAKKAVREARRAAAASTATAAVTAVAPETPGVLAAGVDPDSTAASRSGAVDHASVETIETELRARLAAELEAQRILALEEKRREMEAEMRKQTSESTKQRLLEQYEKDRKEAEENIRDEHHRQRAAMEEKLRTRREKMEAQRLAQMRASVLSSSTSILSSPEAAASIAAKSSTAGGVDVVAGQAPARADGGGASVEEEDQQDVVIRKVLAQAARKQKKKVEIVVEEDSEAERAQEMKALMKQHDAEAKALTSTVLSEQERQRQDMQRRLEEKRKKKAEMAKALAANPVAMEKKQLVDAVRDGQVPKDRAVEAARALLKKRHDKEAADLHRSQEQDRRVRVDEKGEDASWVDMIHAEHRVALRAKHHAELTEVIAAVDPSYAAELEKETQKTRKADDQRQKLQDEMEAFRKAVDSENERVRQQIDVEKKRIEEEHQAAVVREMAAMESELETERQRMEKTIEAERRRKDLAMQQLRQQKELEKELELQLRGELQEEQRKAILETHQKEIQSLLTALDTERAKQELAMRKKMDERQAKRRHSATMKMHALERQRRREMEESALKLTAEAEEAWQQRLQQREKTIKDAVMKLKRTNSKPANITIIRQDSSSQGSGAIADYAARASVSAAASRSGSVSGGAGGGHTLSRQASTSRVVVPPPEPLQMPSVMRLFKLPAEDELHSLLRRSPLFEKLCEIENRIEVLRDEWERLRSAEDRNDADIRKIAADIHTQFTQLASAMS